MWYLWSVVKGFICNQELNNYCFTPMVHHSSRSQTCWMHDAPWHHHLMEPDLWHAWLCCQAHHSHQFHHQWSWYEAEAVWAEQGWVGCCMPASQCSQGVYTKWCSNPTIECTIPLFTINTQSHYHQSCHHPARWQVKTIILDHFTPLFTYTHADQFTSNLPCKYVV